MDQRHNRRLYIAIVILVIATACFVIYSMTYEDPPEEESSLSTDRGAYALHIPTKTTRDT